MTDLFVLAAEPSADLQGAKLVEELLKSNPRLHITAMAGPRMRSLPIDALYPMEKLQVMGFLDVLLSLPKIIHWFFRVRNQILKLNPKAVVCIDYPGFNLRLAKSLRKKGFKGKLIHYVCPTVWAWGKKRIPLMEKNLDLLMTLFPFEKACFSLTKLPVEHVGHPLANDIPPPSTHQESNRLGLFPGSRETEIQRNFPLQLQVAKRLLSQNPSMQVAVSIAHPARAELLKKIAADFPLTFIPPDKNYDLMRTCRLALATSGTVTLELALHEVPTVVNFAIRPLDVFLATKVFRINLPFYCIVNIIASKRAFPELFGPNLTEEALFSEAQALWFNESARQLCRDGCRTVRHLLGDSQAASRAAHLILSQLQSS